MSLKKILEKSLPFSSKEIDFFVMSAPLRYKVYKIKKKEPGKFREVSQPSAEVKLLQRWLMLNVLVKFKVHDSAKAYKAGVGLLDNVSPHVNNRFLLKMDFENFFPSITSGDFFDFMVGKGYDYEDIVVMVSILFKKDRADDSLRLAIGAPSSPLLSNILLYNFDVALDDYCQTLGVVYTRYADDLSFSTKNSGVLNGVEKALGGIIESSCSISLKVNRDKTIHSSKKNGRKITGLVIGSDNKVSIGLERKRLLRSQVYRFKKGFLDPEQVGSLKGYIAFLQSVEPEHVKRLINIYGRETMFLLLS
ncbi:retron St85 family RNA-directed DNA polymerase [Janthinobacterium sp. BJB401]|uniref:retron St85 family RNA-directed DNA polymerase n=1 Tax=Janthinobacterium sp. BJB401 TaxID=2745934 RepID=UPI001594F7D5|nr:retron St85 family RNA-directed DNA polymerase [Janthinobacterium sp. BJB401]NVI83037.1 RNA-directed DNA polymerase [Janthinobacterium sp. BJB401]